jgi:hypothetical protein
MSAEPVGRGGFSWLDIRERMDQIRALHSVSLNVVLTPHSSGVTGWEVLIVAEWMPTTEQNRLLNALEGTRGWAVVSEMKGTEDADYSNSVFLAVDEMAALLWSMMEQTRF